MQQLKKENKQPYFTHRSKNCANQRITTKFTNYNQLGGVRLQKLKPPELRPIEY